jgi:hypothetical protein
MVCVVGAIFILVRAERPSSSHRRLALLKPLMIKYLSRDYKWVMSALQPKGLVGHEWKADWHPCCEL